jgi:SWI/SNF-related matrix-associated actin-dependent regulator of chromatin subfamily A member 5
MDYQKEYSPGGSHGDGQLKKRLQLNLCVDVDAAGQPKLRLHDWWKHQVPCIAWLIEHPAAICAGGLGTGKTGMGISVADNTDCRRILVACPKSVTGVWRRETRKHCARKTETVVLEQGSVKHRTETADSYYRTSSNPLFLIANYEAIIREPLRTWAIAQRWSMVIADEGHRLSVGNLGMTQTARLGAAMRATTERRLVLTGTPLTQSPLSVFGQTLFTVPVFGTDVYAFRERFENKHALGARKGVKACNKLFAELGIEKWIVPEEMMCGVIHEEEYNQLLASIAYRIESSVLDLPPLMTEVRTCKLCPKARVAYEITMREELVDLGNGMSMQSEGGLARELRLQQITSGYLPDRATGFPVPLDNGKETLLRELLQEANAPTVVFCRFRHDLDITERVCLELRLRYAEISQRRKDALTDLAEMREDVAVVGAQWGAGAVGIDLSRARYVVAYSPSYYLPDYSQGIARVHRPPQSNPVVVYRLIVEDSVDELIYRTIDSRKELVNYTLNRLPEASYGCQPAMESV